MHAWVPGEAFRLFKVVSDDLWYPFMAGSPSNGVINVEMNE